MYYGFVIIEGKQAMETGAAAFNRTASSRYHNLSSCDKEKLQYAASNDVEKQMTVRDVSKAAEKSFLKISKEVLPSVVITLL